MCKAFILFAIFLLSFHSVELLNTTNHRRVFFGVPQKGFKYPHSSVVTIRDPQNSNSVQCSGVLIGAKQVLSAAHCFTVDPPGSRYKIGYGSQIVSTQKLMNVENVHYCGSIDVALLRLESSIKETKKMKFFTQDKWTKKDATNMLNYKTYMCGYGYYEGPNRQNPRPTATDVVRCQPYAFTVNYATLLVMRIQDSSWPVPPGNTEGYDHDQRYIDSMSRDPRGPSALEPNFATACKGDSGSPVFLEKGSNKYKLLGIHQSGPSVCGDARAVLTYDTAVHMNAIKNECF